MRYQDEFDDFAYAHKILEKCRTNLEHGLNPIIVTLHERVEMARQMLEDKGIGHRTEAWDLEQFLSTNVFENTDVLTLSRETASSPSW
ncbi:DUF4928 family protein [uncultured Parolsenella sp.]|uniref:DUF4928 family protein n=1 Tax=uncultured Parolsenella sp. TaxID=2083008 RepID=UPI0027D960CD|nr:DUF4928 family protein [uncultured Parolsenella sp.]